MNKPRNIVGPEIRRIRSQRGMTQPELVAKCNIAGWNISRETLAKIESQIRWVADFEVLILASVLNIKPSDILSQSNIHSAAFKAFLK